MRIIIMNESGYLFKSTFHTKEMALCVIWQERVCAIIWIVASCAQMVACMPNGPFFLIYILFWYSVVCQWKCDLFGETRALDTIQVPDR